MLCVRIDGHEVETTPAVLARLVFDGQADRDSAARPVGATAEQPLEQALGAPHGEALTTELHRRLQLLCSMDSSAVDVQELCLQVERLCRWRWPSSPLAARFFWAAAWLHELADHSKSAIDFYDAFLLLPGGEGHLRLLALNNRGVLQIRLGRREGVRDLVRAAVGEASGKLGVRSPTSDGELNNEKAPLTNHTSSRVLPAACFNLLNLINVSFGAPDLLRTVDEELTDSFGRQPEDVRSFWLTWPSAITERGMQGEDTKVQRCDDGRSLRSSDLRTFRPSDPRGPILRDPTYRRLNALIARLSAEARRMTRDFHHPIDHACAVFQRLSLWDCRFQADRSNPTDVGRPGDRFVEDECHRYAEAATLLLSNEVPSSLAGVDDPVTRLEQSAREELFVIESQVASGQYDLALSGLQVQRKILSSIPGRAGMAALLVHVDAQIERIAHLRSQQEQLALQRACAAFVAEVQGFCAQTEAPPAQRMFEDLDCRLQACKAQLPPQTSGEVLRLLDDLAARAQIHVRELKRAQIEQRIREPLWHVRQNRPLDESVPVPASVYQALSRCRLHDPDSWIEDWAALERQLNAHQGRYYAQRALSALGSQRVSWKRVENDLVQALICRPDEWRTVAPLFGLPTGDFGLRRVNDGLEEAPVANPPSAIHQPQFPLDCVGQLLERVLQGLGAHPGKCLELWQCVEPTLRPALAGGDVEFLADARALAERCLRRWPAGSAETPGRADPRHPVNRFLEACDKARDLAEAEQLLGARPSRPDEVKKHLTGVLRSGLDSREQLRRVVTGLYLAQFHEEDSPPVQRQVLAGLEAWVATVPQEGVRRIPVQEIVKETEKVRALCRL